MKWLIAAMMIIASQTVCAIDNWTPRKYGAETTYDAGFIVKLMVGSSGVGISSASLHDAPVKVSVDGGPFVTYKTNYRYIQLVVLEDSKALADQIKSAKVIQIELSQCETPACRMTLNGERKSVKWEFETTIKGIERN